MIHPDSQPQSNLSPSIDFDEFWHSFRFFPLRFDEYAFTHWYLFTIGLEGVLLILAVSSDLIDGFAIPAHDGLYYFLHEFHNSATYGVLTDWIYISGVVAVSLIALAFNSWRRSIPTTFQELYNDPKISDKMITACKV